MWAGTKRLLLKRGRKHTTATYQLALRLFARGAHLSALLDSLNINLLLHHQRFIKSLLVAFARSSSPDGVLSLPHASRAMSRGDASVSAGPAALRPGQAFARSASRGHRHRHCRWSLRQLERARKESRAEGSLRVGSSTAERRASYLQAVLGMDSGPGMGPGLGEERSGAVELGPAQRKERRDLRPDSAQSYRFVLDRSAAARVHLGSAGADPQMPIGHSSGSTARAAPASLAC
jgi:hypothetical protein